MRTTRPRWPVSSISAIKLAITPVGLAVPPDTINLPDLVTAASLTAVLAASLNPTIASRRPDRPGQGTNAPCSTTRVRSPFAVAAKLPHGRSLHLGPTPSQAPARTA